MCGDTKCPAEQGTADAAGLAVWGFGVAYSALLGIVYLTLLYCTARSTHSKPRACRIAGDGGLRPLITAEM
jgi:hypothetical protein